MAQVLLVLPRCPVCAQPLPATPWRCTRCETPHHAECAEYFGGCAIFGCRDGHVPDRMERETWPNVVRRLRFFVWVRRFQMLNLTAVALSFPGIALSIALEKVAWLVGPMLAFSLLALLFGGLGAVLGYMASACCFAQLERSVAESTRGTSGLSLERVRSGMPGLPPARPLTRALRVLGAGVLGLAALLLLAMTVLTIAPQAIRVMQGIAFTCGVGGGLLLAVAQLSAHDRDMIDLFVGRFEASFAPLPDKSKSPDDRQLLL